MNTIQKLFQNIQTLGGQRQQAGTGVTDLAEWMSRADQTEMAGNDHIRRLKHRASLKTVTTALARESPLGDKDEGRKHHGKTTYVGVHLGPLFGETLTTCATLVNGCNPGVHELQNGKSFSAIPALMATGVKLHFVHFM